MEQSILQLFPIEQREFWRETALHQKDLQEIRLRTGRPVLLYGKGKEYFLDAKGRLQCKREAAVCVEAPQIERILETICQNSFYAFEDALKQGFLSVPGGHRVGIAGQAVLDAQGRIRTMKNIAFLNIRVSHQVPGAGEKVLSRIYEAGQVKNVLILSPPGCGKTTLLRDLIRLVSEGNEYGEGRNVAVVDERSELAGTFLGQPQNDLGIRTDILDGCGKIEGILLLLRSMAPKVIAVDELGSREELQALQAAAAAGCSILATAHGSSREDLEKRFGIPAKELQQVFPVMIGLKRQGEIADA